MLPFHTTSNEMLRRKSPSIVERSITVKFKLTVALAARSINVRCLHIRNRLIISSLMLIHYRCAELLQRFDPSQMAEDSNLSRTCFSLNETHILIISIILNFHFSDRFRNFELTVHGILKLYINFGKRQFLVSCVLS